MKIEIKSAHVRRVVNWATQEVWFVTINFVLIGMVSIVVYGCIRDHLDWGTDDTDLNGRNRSGMHLFTDYGTGVQYLASPHGGITPRLDQEGNIMLWKGSNDE